METLLEKYPLKGMLFSLVRIYDEMGQQNEALLKVESWLQKYPQDQELQMLYDYLIDKNSFQKLIKLKI